MKKLVVATTNNGKLKEIKALLEDLKVEVLSLADFTEIPEIEENGNTFIENALIKARTIRDITGLLTIADDSGLEVDALNGMPGVYSARFAGEPKNDTRNNMKLIELMKDVPENKRTARFKCAIAICSPETQEHVVEGSCEGIILTEPRGMGGFGYDPLFLLPDYDLTFSELDMKIKNDISHRGKALLQARNIIGDVLLGERLS